MVKFDITMHFAVQMPYIFLMGEGIKITFKLFEVQNVLSAAASLDTIEREQPSLLYQPLFDTAKTAEKVFEFILKFGIAAHFYGSQIVHTSLLCKDCISL
jgi:hypothetical protein